MKRFVAAIAESLKKTYERRPDECRTLLQLTVEEEKMLVKSKKQRIKE